MNTQAQIFKIEFYVPESHLDPVKSAMFDAGAGRVGDYDYCAWQTLGSGQFRPLEGSSPFLGETNRVESVSEYKVEMVCAAECLAAVIAALKQSHPYEEPAYSVLKTE